VKINVRRKAADEVDLALGMLGVRERSQSQGAMMKRWQSFMTFNNPTLQQSAPLEFLLKSLRKPPTPRGVLVFKQSKNGAWKLSNQGKLLQALQFPANMDDVSKMAGLWTVKLYPHPIEYRGRQLASPKPVEVPLASILNFGNRKSFNNRSTLIDTVKETVESLAQLDSAERLMDLWGLTP
jgi:hypothetical protein